jgi:hypothetical protein
MRGAVMYRQYSFAGTSPGVVYSGDERREDVHIIKIL